LNFLPELHKFCIWQREVNDKSLSRKIY
jgi:hypothetical protein